MYKRVWVFIFIFWGSLLFGEADGAFGEMNASRVTLKEFQRAEVSCTKSKKEAKGCHYLGLIYEGGIENVEQNFTVEQNLTKAFGYYKQACERGFMEACVLTGLMYSFGKGVEERNYTKAAPLFTKACDAGQVEGCFNLAVLYEWGAGVLRNMKKAREMYENLCMAGNERACDGVERVKKAQEMDQNSIKALP